MYKYRRGFAPSELRSKSSIGNKSKMNETKPDLRNKLINDLWMLESDAYNYQHLKLIACDKVSNEAAHITCSVYREEGTATLWIPRSVLRIDKNYGLWVKKWFYDKKIYKLF